MELKQIEARMAEIEKAIDTETDPAKIEELGKEARNLVELRGQIKGETIEKRRGEARGAFETPQKPETRDNLKLSKRQALELALGLNARRKAPDEMQARALGVALTSTATTFVEATSSVDGVNNAGLLIPTKILYDYLKEEGKLSPILRDVLFTNVKGLVTFPYRKSRDAAKAKAEGAGTGKNQFELAELTLQKGWLQIVIDVTEEVLSLTDIDLGAYILDNIVNDLGEDWAYDIIYGSGTGSSPAHIKGITTGAVTTGINAYTNVVAALEAGVKLLPGKYRRGAKIYVAQDVFDEIAFAKDENGVYLYPVINNTAGVRSFGVHTVELDENLAEGDFLIGNVGKYYKANILRDTALEHDKDINSHIHTFVASAFIAAAPFPNAFAFGSKSV